MIRLPLLDADDAESFPDPRRALSEPNGLLAFGGDLSPQRLLAAYRRGIFPWFGEDDPILWWSPDPRCVFRSEELRPNRSLRRLLTRQAWRVSFDQAFSEVIRACAAPRGDGHGTWIVPAMIEAYEALHARGQAHSVEVWEDGRLVGGLYGVAVGRLFCGESMFSRASGGSKVALHALAQLLRSWEFPLLDAQVSNPHLLSLGAHELPRESFLREAAELVRHPDRPGHWAEQQVDLQALGDD